MTFPWDAPWYRLYDVIGIRGFIDFVNSSEIQSALLPVKIVFILFTVFFFCAIIYFYLNSSYLKTQITQNVSEFVSWQAYGLKEVNKRWKAIIQKVQAGSEKEYKLAIVEADAYLFDELQDADISGTTFEELTETAGVKKMLPNKQNIISAHRIRDLIVRDVNYVLDVNVAKKILDDYEKALKSIYSY